MAAGVSAAARSGGLGLLRGLELGNDATAAQVTTRIGTADPVKDFRSLILAARGDSAPIADAAAQLADVVTALASDPFTVDRALDLVLEFRRQATHNLPELVPRFNAYLLGLRATQGRDAAPPHGSMLWQRLLCTSTSLISLLECAGASGAVSPAEQATFFLVESSLKTPAAALPAQADVDDDLGLE